MNPSLSTPPYAVTTPTPPSELSPCLSQRGILASNRPPLLKCALFANQYDAQSNPDGIVSLAVAENSLMADHLLDYFSKHFHLELHDFSYGTALCGSLRLFKALRLLFDVYFQSHTPVLREHIVSGVGCGSVIDHLVGVICDVGDGILVSAPFYTGFDASFSCRNGVEAVAVELEPGFEGDEAAIEAYEKKLIESKARGVEIKAVMLCNPNNPLGFCYSRQTLIAYLRFAQKWNIHLISDEIYALSTFKNPELPNAQPFVSILSINPLREAGCDPARVHQIYGASKDFCCNGLRLGILVSQANPRLRLALESSALLMKISSPSDALWSTLLLDPAGLPHFINENQVRIAEAYHTATVFLNRHQIPFRPSNAGHFVFIDLRRWLPVLDASGNPFQTDVEREEVLAERLLSGGVMLARGTAYRHRDPGFFRMTFTVRPDFLQVGLRRMEAALGLLNTGGQVPTLEEEVGEDFLRDLVACRFFFPFRLPIL